MGGSRDVLTQKYAFRFVKNKKQRSGAQKILCEEDRTAKQKPKSHYLKVNITEDRAKFFVVFADKGTTSEPMSVLGARRYQHVEYLEQSAMFQFVSKTVILVGNQ